MKKQEQTPCEALGYKVGDTFEVVMGLDDSFSTGSIILLAEDGNIQVS